MAKHKSRLILIFALVLGVLTLGVIFAVFTFNSILSPVNPKLSTPTIFTVQKGDSVSKVGENLTAAGLVRSPLAFRLAVYLEKVGGKIQAGDFQLAGNQSARAIASGLTRAYAADNIITIPEGYRLEQIADLAESKLGIPYGDFVAAAKGREGYLFPDTYAFAKDASAATVVERLEANFKLKTKQDPINIIELILASIIERETLSDAEKPIVAGILVKRSKESWPLEVDASIQYIMGKRGNWWPVPLLGDRKIKSPYNTYLNLGLTPNPICNPGLASIQAALHPVDSPYYFYLHDKQGNIHYAATNQEHTVNINKYIR